MSSIDPVSFEFDVPFQGRSVHVVLASLLWCKVAPLAVSPTFDRRPNRTQRFASNLFRSVDLFDGMPRLHERTAIIDSDPAAVAAIFAKRYDIYMAARAAGRMFARCPHCNEGELELSLLSLFDVLGALPPEMFSADFAFFLDPISTGSAASPTRPNHVAYASRLRFELPTKRLDLPRAGFDAGYLHRTDPYRAVAAEERWGTDGVNVPIEQAWRSARLPAFTATLQLLAALPDASITIETFEQLPAIDVYFLDAIYQLAFETGVPEHVQPRSCPHCGRGFVPVGR